MQLSYACSYGLEILSLGCMHSLYSCWQVRRTFLWWLPAYSICNFLLNARNFLCVFFMWIKASPKLYLNSFLSCSLSPGHFSFSFSFYLKFLGKTTLSTQPSRIQSTGKSNFEFILRRWFPNSGIFFLGGWSCPIPYSEEDGRSGLGLVSNDHIL